MRLAVQEGSSRSTNNHVAYKGTYTWSSSCIISPTEAQNWRDAMGSGSQHLAPGQHPLHHRPDAQLIGDGQRFI